jgi:hypothetical protein
MAAEASSATIEVIRMTHAVTPRLADTDSAMAPATEFIVTPSPIVGVTLRTKLLRRR